MKLERFCGLLLLLLGLCVVVAAWGFYVPYQYEPLGPKAVPFAVGFLLSLCGLSLLLELGQKPARSAWTAAQELEWKPGPLWLCFALLAYALCYEFLGFVVASLLLSVSLAWLCGASLGMSLAIALGLTGVGHLVLVIALGLQLPEGLLRGWL